VHHLGMADIAVGKNHRIELRPALNGAAGMMVHP
jgi:hypothetical protein